jgi:hypothetical protein
VAAALAFGLGRNGAADWQMQAQFYRVDAHGSSVLPDGAGVALGDRLMLEFRSSRPAHVYIFDDDGSAQAAVLFPLAGLELVNPLAANTTHHLPGKTGGMAMSWQISRTAPREAFVVVASDTAQPELDHAIDAWQHAAQAPGSTRGALDLVPAPAETGVENQALHAALQRLEQSGGADHLRRWRFVFPHTAG